MALQGVGLDGLRHRGATDVLDVLNGGAVEVGSVGKGSDSVVEVKVQNLVHPVALYSKSVQAEFQMDVMIVKSTSKRANFFKDDLMCLKSGNGKDEKQAKGEEYLAAKVAASSGGATSSASGLWGRRRGCCWAAVALVQTLDSV